MVNLLHCGQFRSVGHLCDGNKHNPTNQTLWDASCLLPAAGMFNSTSRMDSSAGYVSVGVWTSVNSVSVFVRLTKDVSSLGLCRQQGVTDAIDVLSHDPDDVLTTLDQLRHLKKQTAAVVCQY